MQLLTYGKPRKSHSSTFTLFYRTFLELLGQLFAWLTNMKRNPLPGYRHLLMPSLLRCACAPKATSYGASVFSFFTRHPIPIPISPVPCVPPSGGSGNASCARAQLLPSPPPLPPLSPQAPPTTPLESTNVSKVKFVRSQSDGSRVEWGHCHAADRLAHL